MRLTGATRKLFERKQENQINSITYFIYRSLQITARAGCNCVCCIFTSSEVDQSFHENSTFISLRLTLCHQPIRNHFVSSFELFRVTKLKCCRCYLLIIFLYVTACTLICLHLLLIRNESNYTSDFT